METWSISNRISQPPHSSPARTISCRTRISLLSFLCSLLYFQLLLVCWFIAKLLYFGLYLSSPSQIKIMRAPHTNSPSAPCTLLTATAIAFLLSHTQTLNRRAFLNSHSHSSPHPVSTFHRQIQTKLTHDHHCQISNRLFNHVAELLSSTKHVDHSVHSS